MKAPNKSLKAASHGIRLRLTIRIVANGSLHTGSVARIRVNFLGFDRLPAKVSRTAGFVSDGILVV